MENKILGEEEELEIQEEKNKFNERASAIFGYSVICNNPEQKRGEFYKTGEGLINIEKRPIYEAIYYEDSIKQLNGIGVLDFRDKQLRKLEDQYRKKIKMIKYSYDKKRNLNTKKEIYIVSGVLKIKLNIGSLDFHKNNKRIAYIDLNQSDFGKILKYCFENDIKQINVEKLYQEIDKTKGLIDSEKAFRDCKSGFISKVRNDNYIDIKDDIDYLINKIKGNKYHLELNYEIV